MLLPSCQRRQSYRRTACLGHVTTELSAYKTYIEVLMDQLSRACYYYTELSEKIKCVLKYRWTETIRLIRDGEKGVEGNGGGGSGRLYTYRYTDITRMTPALRWAALRAILMFH